MAYKKAKKDQKVCPGTLSTDKKNARPLRERLLARIRMSIGLPKDQKKPFVVGVSGGSDSMALLDLLWKGSWQMSVIHINHHLREKAAKKDAALVEKECKKRGINCDIKNIHVKKIGTEADARAKRHALFAKKIVITAHHADDQAETLLLHLLRGTSLEGLQGMHAHTTITTPKGRCTIIRPLLSSTKEELRTYCRQNKIPYREDATNRNTQYTRNFIRHKVLPLLAQKNPRITHTLANTTATITETFAYLNTHVDSVFKKIAPHGVLDQKKFVQLPEPLQKMIITKILKNDLSTGRIKECHQFLRHSRSARHKTFGHTTLNNKKNFIQVFQKKETPSKI